MHRIYGYAEGMIGVKGIHFHFFSGVSSYTDHTHYFSGITSLPVKTENGHIHRIDGLLEFNNFHEHKFKGDTFEDISYINGTRTREALI